MMSHTRRRCADGASGGSARGRSWKNLRAHAGGAGSEGGRERERERERESERESERERERESDLERDGEGAVSFNLLV